MDWKRLAMAGLALVWAVQFQGGLWVILFSALATLILVSVVFPEHERLLSGVGGLLAGGTGCYWAVTGNHLSGIGFILIGLLTIWWALSNGSADGGKMSVS
ncbi:hypothetical protein [Haloarchaeobius baliensis]|uniref:hypothetical protein n=1 Tax=Haloarchaeobius baliensis TaxID=1670458 RepID=UPI003F8808A2